MSSQPFLLGHLVTERGEFREFVGGRNEKSMVLFFHNLREFNTPWKHPYTLMPWVVFGIIYVVNSYRTFVHEVGRATRDLTAKRWAKTFGVKKADPAAVLHGHAQERARDRACRGTLGKRGWAWCFQHRFDVCGHERIRLRRGPLPSLLAERQIGYKR